jgi:hypothetical protein
MRNQIKCPHCNNLRPSDEIMCGSCGADLYPSEMPRNLTKAEFRTTLPSINANSEDNSLLPEKYSSLNAIKYIRRPMNSWLAIGTDYYNMYFGNDKLIIARVHSGRWGLIGAIVGLPFYLIVFILTMQIGNWLDEKQGKGQCDKMEDNLGEIMKQGPRYKVKIYSYGQRVVFEKNETCNSGKMKHKISIEGDEYYFDDFEADIAREKFRKCFDVIQGASG